MQSIAILPAAGRSMRVGRPKLLLPWGRTTLVEHVLATWRASQVEHVIVVTHPDDQELADICNAAGADVVRAEHPPADMKASVRLGLAYARQKYQPCPDDAWLLAPADMPLIETVVIDELLRQHATAPAKVHIPTFDGRRGHPIVLPWNLASEVLGTEANAGALPLPEGRGIDALLALAPSVEVAVTSSGILEDVDTRQDYERLLRQDRPNDSGAETK